MDSVRFPVGVLQSNLRLEQRQRRRDVEVGRFRVQRLDERDLVPDQRIGNDRRGLPQQAVLAGGLPRKSAEVDAGPDGYVIAFTSIS